MSGGGLAMYLTELRVRNLRIFGELELTLDPGWNLFLGPNGAGKSSVLEAAYLLSHGQSFRRGARDTLTRFDSPGFACKQPAGIRAVSPSGGTRLERKPALMARR